jgi:predicted RNA-binding Zn ribbon-like protein
MPIEWRTPGTLGGLSDLLAVHAWQLLQNGDPSRLRQCRGEGCGWLFLDGSRNGSRVWCSSADCGNRSRARRHYRRHRAAGPGGEDR